MSNRTIIGSYGDTIEDEEILALLRKWNATGKALHRAQ